MRFAPRLSGFGFGRKKPITPLAQWDGWNLAIDFKGVQYRQGASITTTLSSIAGYTKVGTNTVTSAGYHVTGAPSMIEGTSALPSGNFVALAVATFAGAAAANEAICEWSDGSVAKRLFMFRRDTGYLTIYHSTNGYFVDGQQLAGAGRAVIAYAYQGTQSLLFTKAGAAAATRNQNGVLAPPTGITKVAMSTLFDGTVGMVGDLELVAILPGTFTDAAIIALMGRV